ncbi:hypothetical protein [Bradyrhizobium sp. SZCCHNR2012]|uniref:hypothetical protein n=1 Tax=Bradyrhizobium sp. SZCCHNR2012 TaxID=3057377 RepID=UPI0028E36D40|nr:hypothetical protein [Bradyrhizobium sp. SZCCHNR2012]
MAGRAGETSFHRTPGFDKIKARYIAKVTTLLAELAAEPVVLGEYADDGSGSIDSDLYQATLVATAVEASLGLGRTLTCMTSTDPDQLIERLKNDPALVSALRVSSATYEGRPSAGPSRTVERFIPWHVNSSLRPVSIGSISRHHLKNGRKIDPTWMKSLLSGDDRFEPPRLLHDPVTLFSIFDAQRSIRH